MAGNYWIKFYVEILDDPKMAMLDDHTWRRFYECCLIAGKYNKGGLLPPIDQMAWLLRVSAKDLQDDITELIEVDLVIDTPEGYVVKNFVKRQERMSNAEKQIQFRERKQKDEYYSNQSVTECNKSALPKVTEITDNRTDNRNRAEQNEIAPSAPIPASISQTGDAFYSRVFSTVTGMTAIPGNDMPKVLSAMDGLRVKYRTETEMIDYLKPYFEHWKTKRTKTGMPYSKSNCAWLYDMAVAGDPLPSDPKIPDARPDPDCKRCGGVGMRASGEKDIHAKNFGRLVKCECVKVYEEVDA